MVPRPSSPSGGDIATPLVEMCGIQAHWRSAGAGPPGLVNAKVALWRCGEAKVFPFLFPAFLIPKASRQARLSCCLRT